MNINDPTGSIQSREDFVAFVQALSKDFQDNPADWENDTVDRYLEALSAWTHDMDGLYHNTAQTPPSDVNWRFITQLLLAAKIYE